MNDETILATALAKVDISSAVLYDLGLYTMTSFVVLNLLIDVIPRIGIAVMLNHFGSKYHITDAVVNFIANDIEFAQ